MTNTQLSPLDLELELELANMGLSSTSEDTVAIDSFFSSIDALRISTETSGELSSFLSTGEVPPPPANTPSTSFDFLNYIDSEIWDIESKKEIPPIISIKKNPPFGKIRERIQFGLHYISVTCIVFWILLVATNWSAYSAIAHNYFNPVELKDASNKIESALIQSKITVYANEENSELHSTELSVKAEDIKEQLHADSQTIEEAPFNIQSLIPTKPSVSVSFEITPYENRIIIPKIGKNIPLVDIAGESGFDFDHMENIFMQELEKGVVRYPGTALPGQAGNAFIFGHSSNYPWIKGDYNDVFALIDHLEFGDKIIVYYNQKKLVYTIREKKIIKPGDVKALERDSNKSELSLMTCWPIGTTLKRMLVFAELTND